MKDPRIDELAAVLIDHSCQLKAGEKVLIEAFDLPETNLVCSLVETARARGGHPLVLWKNNEILRSLYQHSDREGLQLMGELEAEAMSRVDAYIGIRGALNSDQMSDVSGSQMDLMTECLWKPVHIDIRVPKTKWVVLRYPTHSMAQAARVSQQTAFFHMGKLIETNDTETIFTNPQNTRTQDYITGRFG